jgi:hypothetical protein
MIHLIIIILAILFVVIIEKPCIWGLSKHKWSEFKNKDVCFKCGLVKNKVRKK